MCLLALSKQRLSTIFQRASKFQPYVCNRCHVLLMMSMNLSNIAILTIENNDYHCIVTAISKNEDIKLLKNINLTEKSGTL